ncbi:hypothetical protein Q7P37_011422 [Cladosporium fusiforme]
MSTALITDVDKKLLRTTKFPPEFEQKVDMEKVNVPVIKTWVTDEIARILNSDDDIVTELISNVLEESTFPKIKELQIMITGFLDKDAAPFAKALWKLLLSAQNGPQGVPQELLEAKKALIAKEKLEDAKIREEAIQRQEAERERDRELSRMRDRERGEREDEEDATVADSMTEEAATAIRDLLLQEFATTDTEALLHSAELTATSQDAPPETTLPAVAAHPPTIARAAARLPLHVAAAATPPVLPPPAPRPASPTDAATTDPDPGLLPEMQMTAETAKAKTSVVTKAADPVHVLLLTGAAHAHPDVTANPTTPAAEGHLPKTVDPLHRRNAAAALRHPSLAHHRADAVISPAPAHLRAHQRDTETSGLMMRPHLAVTSVG